MKQLITLLLRLLLITGCGSTQQTVTENVVEDDTIKIGVVAPRTGPLTFYGDYQVNAYEMAVDEHRAKGKKIELVIEDTMCEPKPTVTGLMKLHHVDKVAAILGPFCGSSSKAAGAFAQANKAVVVTPADNFGRIYEYQFNTAHQVKEEPLLVADYLIDHTDIRKVGVIFYDNDWGREYLVEFKKLFEERGGEVVAEEPFDFLVTDFRSMITKVDGRGAEAIYNTAETSGKLVEQIKELQYEGIFISTTEMENPDIIRVMGQNREGVVYSGLHYELADQETHRKFVEEYKERYDEDWVSFYSMYAYDAANVLIEALDNCEIGDNECLYDQMNGLADYRGAAGSISFNDDYYGTKVGFRMKQIINNTPVLLE